MRWMLILIITALAATQSWAQAVQLDADRQERVAKVLTLANQSPGDPKAALAAKDAYLQSLAPELALQTELDILEMAVRDGVVDRQGPVFSRENLRLVDKYGARSDPNHDAIRDYWAYRVMIDTQLSKGSIAPEEHEYLASKKHMEMRRHMDETANRERASVLEAEQRMRQERDQQAAQAAAYEREVELQRTQIMVDSMRRSLQSIQRPAPTICRSVRTGYSTQTICN
ncbi:MAG: hypothetical protein KF871_10775 [Hydrogenophaga sp.]|uniref:hypothetical protein n=1 Tax=Hydrogenophaga sp. TaxID=1904254 RepID=UPI001D742AE7|nr:hypothetical protein [Hydrogenophaga sp.]MBX3610365.1 hypothetical protein [Hydrogenophaga sp.]